MSNPTTLIRFVLINCKYITSNYTNNVVSIKNYDYNLDIIT